MTINPRRELRLKLQCPVTYSDYDIDQNGMVLNLSMWGCRVSGRKPPTPGAIAWLCLGLPGVQQPLEIEEARVQWVQGRQFGLLNVAMSLEHRKRLRRYLDAQYLQKAKDNHAQIHTGREAQDAGDTGVRLAESQSFSVDTPRAAFEKSCSNSTHSTQSPPCHADILIGDALTFIDWMLHAHRTIEQRQQLPHPPDIRNNTIQGFIQFVQNLKIRATQSHGSKHIYAA
jgi:hypothetical protein